MRNTDVRTAVFIAIFGFFVPVAWGVIEMLLFNAPESSLTILFL
jgi:hypothetical protein